MTPRNKNADRRNVNIRAKMQTAREVWTALRNNPGSTASQIKSICGISPTTINMRLREFAAFDMVSKIIKRGQCVTSFYWAELDCAYNVTPHAIMLQNEIDVIEREYGNRDAARRAIRAARKAEEPRWYFEQRGYYADLQGLESVMA